MCRRRRSDLQNLERKICRKDGLGINSAVSPISVAVVGSLRAKAALELTLSEHHSSNLCSQEMEPPQRTFPDMMLDAGISWTRGEQSISTKPILQSKSNF
eukprot:4852096-Amphidinium_carterae.1